MTDLGVSASDLWRIRRAAVDSGTINVAIRVRNLRETVKALQAKGYREDGSNGDLLTVKVSPGATARFPQLFHLDPDRHVIEVNAERLGALGALQEEDVSWA